MCYLIPKQMHQSQGDGKHVGIDLILESKSGSMHPVQTYKHEMPNALKNNAYFL